MMGPLVAKAGTDAVRLLPPPWGLAEAAAVPLNVTTSRLAKPDPVMVTTVPTGPEVGEKPVIERLPDACAVAIGAAGTLSARNAEQARPHRRCLFIAPRFLRALVTLPHVSNRDRSKLS
jgi:hypothetical protein